MHSLPHYHCVHTEREQTNCAQPSRLPLCTYRERTDKLCTAFHTTTVHIQRGNRQTVHSLPHYHCAHTEREQINCAQPSTLPLCTYRERTDKLCTAFHTTTVHIQRENRQTVHSLPHYHCVHTEREQTNCAQPSTLPLCTYREGTDKMCTAFHSATVYIQRGNRQTVHSLPHYHCAHTEREQTKCAQPSTLPLCTYRERTDKLCTTFQPFIIQIMSRPFSWHCTYLPASNTTNRNSRFLPSLINALVLSDPVNACVPRSASNMSLPSALLIAVGKYLYLCLVPVQKRSCFNQMAVGTSQHSDICIR